MDNKRHAIIAAQKADLDAHDKSAAEIAVQVRMEIGYSVGDGEDIEKSN